MMATTTSTRRKAIPTATPKTIASPVFDVARQLRSWADTVLGIAGPATDMAFVLAKANAKEPKKKEAIDKAGALLRGMREKAGLSARDLAGALNLSDPELITRAEGGKAALPFELILRVAAVVGRDDPMTTAIALTRAYNPGLWKALEDIGVGRLAVQAGREREFANIYRGNDAARKLSDKEFADVLGFTKTGFDMAVKFKTDAGKK